MAIDAYVLIAWFAGASRRAGSRGRIDCATVEAAEEQLDAVEAAGEPRACWCSASPA